VLSAECEKGFSVRVSGRKESFVESLACHAVLSGEALAESEVPGASRLGTKAGRKLCRSDRRSATTVARVPSPGLRRRDPLAGVPLKNWTPRSTTAATGSVGYSLLAIGHSSSRHAACPLLPLLPSVQTPEIFTAKTQSSDKTTSPLRSPCVVPSALRASGRLVRHSSVSGGGSTGPLRLCGERSL